MPVPLSALFNPPPCLDRMQALILEIFNRPLAGHRNMLQISD